MKRPTGDPTAVREAMLEIMTDAALAGHDLTPFHPVESGGYQSRCRRCGSTITAVDPLCEKCNESCTPPVYLDTGGTGA